jgi:hypothetical protein
VTIFSESESYEPFTVFEERNYSVQLDTDLSIVWKSLMTADVAILSRSSFSFAPALLNPNTVVYSPFWHQPVARPGWEVVNETVMNESRREMESMVEDSCNKLTRWKKVKVRVSKLMEDANLAWFD